MAIEYGPATSGFFDRRIGRRDDRVIDIAWVSESTTAGKHDGDGQPGRIVNLSVTGAAIERPGDPRCLVGSHARIRVGGGETGVRVRRAEPTDDDPVVRYGVEFVDLNQDQRSRDAIFSRLSEGRPGESAWRDAL